MKIDRIDLSIIRIPFRFAYGHSQKTHNEVEAIFCQVRSVDGVIGLGEAVPRSYVTGETATSALKDAEALAARLIDNSFTCIEDIFETMRSEARRITGPFPSSSFCALDLALHDCLARHHGEAMAEHLGTQSRALSYTASIGLSGKVKLKALLMAYRLSGITSFKLKVGDPHDAERLAVIKNVMGEDVRVFADANGAWNEQEAVRQIDTLSSAGVWAIEEPLEIPMPSGATKTSLQIDRESILDTQHFERYARLKTTVSIPVVLDESLISIGTYEQAIKLAAADILNIRLSKLGGLSLALDMIDRMPQTMQYSIGAMVGESPVLAAAGYYLGCTKPAHRWIQGFSHRILHGRTITRGGPRMKRGQVYPCKDDGLGLTIRPNSLDSVTITQKIVIRGET